MKRNVIIGIGVVLVIFFFIFVFRKNQSPSRTSPESVQQWYEQALNFRKDGELLKAKEIYQKILAEHPDFQDIEKIQKELGDVNMAIIFSNAPTPNSVIYEVQPGDSIAKLAQKYKTTMDLIKKDNHLSGDVIRAGQKLRIWTGEFNVFVDKSQNVLLLKEGDEVVKVYQVSTGANNSTPVGEFKIVNKLVDPVWFNRGAVVPPESPANVLGSRWLGFDIPGYGIHGTIEPQTIGQQVTAGCVRMTKQDVEEIYTLLPVGTKVTIVD